MLTLERQSDGDEDDDEDGEDNEKEEATTGVVAGSDDMKMDMSSSSSSSSSNISRLIQQWKQELSSSRNQKTPLTSAGRARLEKEIDLLQQFGYDSFRASQQLEQLWKTSRGGKAYQALQIAEGIMIRDGGNLLIELIEQEDCITTNCWMEPLVSLANLLYLQNRIHDSKELYTMVLQQKPWHFNAINGLHKCNQSLGLASGKEEEMIDIATTSNSGPTRRLQQWSTDMVILARSYLQQSECNLQNYFNDSYDTTTDSSILGVESVSSSSSSSSSAATTASNNEFVDAWQ